MPNLLNITSLQLGDAFAYLTTHCQWTQQRLKHFKGDDGHKMFTDGHVEDLSRLSRQDMWRDRIHIFERT